MVTKKLFAACLSAATLLGACRNNSDSFDYKAGTGNETPKHQSSHYNDAGNQAHPDKTDHKGQPAMSEKDSLSPADQQLLIKMIESNRKEIALSQLGTERLTREPLRNTASMLVRHHQDMLTNLTKLAESKMISLPETTAAPALNGAKGDAFDRQWTQMQVQMHEESLATNRQAVNVVQSPAFQSLIKAAIPTIESHLTELKQRNPQ